MDSETVQLPSCSDLALAKLRLKLSKITVDLGIDGYQDDCVDVIFDYTVMFMKTVIRSMAQHKRKYKVVCPILTGKSEENEPTTTKKESPEETLWPWQVKINWEVVKEQNIKFLDANDFKDVEESGSQRDKSFDREAWFAELSKSRENIDIDALCLKKQSLASLKTVDKKSSNFDKKTRSTNKKRSYEEYTQKMAKKKTNECLMSETVYSSNKFDLWDMMELLKVETHVIPIKSIYDIIQMDLREKLAKKFRF